MKKYLKIIACFLIIVCVCGAASFSHANDISEVEKTSCIGKVFSFLWGLIYYPIYFLWLCVYWLAMGIYYAVYYLIQIIWFCIYWLVVGIYYTGYYIIKSFLYVIFILWSGLKWLFGNLYWILDKILMWFKDVKNWFEDLIFSTFGAVLGTVIFVLIGYYVIKPAKDYANKIYEESSAKEFVDNTADYAKEKFDEVRDNF